MSRTFMTLLFAGSISACSQTGDFDRPTMSVRDPGSLGYVGSVSAAHRGEPVSHYTLTYHEERMRQTGYRLIQPLGENAHWRDHIAAYRFTRVVPVRRPLSEGHAYYEILRAEHRRYEDALWNKIVEDIGHDQISAVGFHGDAARVLDQDAERLEIYRSRGGEAHDGPDLFARIDENKGFIELVRASLEDRIAAYGHAIDRAELETPSPAVHTARAQLADLAYQLEDIAYLASGRYQRRQTHAGYTRRRTQAPPPNGWSKSGPQDAEYPVIEPPIVDLSD